VEQIKQAVMKNHFHATVWAVIALALAAVHGTAQTVYTPYTFTTIAGNSGFGSVDGTGSVARFNLPAGVAVDIAGNLFVVDRKNNTVRQVTPAGVVTTIAGKAGQTGSTDGAGNVARFNNPWGVAVDSADNIYVADSGNYSIRKIATVGSNWMVTTMAGLAGNPGYMDGTGNAARFNAPTGVAVDGAGNVYVADQGYDTIRKLTPAGATWVVTTLAGVPGDPDTADGAGSGARFSSPTSLAVDSTGNLYVADAGNNAIRKLTQIGTNWVVTTLAGVSARFGGSTDGTGSAARFGAPYGVATDSAGVVYVADTGNNTIRRIAPGAVVTTMAGTPGPGQSGDIDGTGSVARFSGPFGVAVDKAGAVYVTDTSNNSIRKGRRVPPSIIPDGAGFGFNNGQFGFLLTGPDGENVVVQGSSDFATWIPVWTNTFSGPLFFSDPTGVFSNRFYRLLLP
jgi:hypothetical protein